MVWGYIKKTLSLKFLKTKELLKEAILEIWEKVPQEQI